LVDNSSPRLHIGRRLSELTRLLSNQEQRMRSQKNLWLVSWPDQGRQMSIDIDAVSMEELIFFGGRLDHNTTAAGQRRTSFYKHIFKFSKRTEFEGQLREFRMR